MGEGVTVTRGQRASPDANTTVVPVAARIVNTGGQCSATSTGGVLVQ